VLALSSPHDEFRVGKMGPLYQHLLRSALQQLREKLPRITGRQHLSTAGLAAVSVKVALWQPGQLDQELQGGLWFNVPANPQRMLNEAVPPWHELVREVGRSVYRDALGISEFPANVWLN
jgi:putative AlgH/UPF0301 family transcriptional regulator